MIRAVLIGAATVAASAAPSRADFFDGLRRTFQHDIPHTFTHDVPHAFQHDIPRAFGAEPKEARPTPKRIVPAARRQAPARKVHRE